MKRKIGIFFILVVCAIWLGMACGGGNLEGKDSYNGLPVYRYNSEGETVEIDGVPYEAVSEIPREAQLAMNYDNQIGYLWQSPHPKAEAREKYEGVVYRLYTDTGNKDFEYIDCVSWYYRVGKVDYHYEFYLKRVE
ncbi:MAG: hypothetical protein VB082_10790 [Christensenella sp.]|nr:hypothetical protein [Christensenella sp.]